MKKTVKNNYNFNFLYFFFQIGALFQQFGEKRERILNWGYLRKLVYRNGTESQIRKAVSGEATAVISVIFLAAIATVGVVGVFLEDVASNKAREAVVVRKLTKAWLLVHCLIGSVDS